MSTCWCSANEWRICFRKKSFGLIRCSRCGCYRISPPAVTTDADAAEFYTEYYEGPQAPGLGPVHRDVRSSRFWRVVAEDPELGVAGQRALDIGCGEGTLCGELKAAGWASVVGMDLSRSRVARARRLHPGIEFHDVPLPQTDLAAESVDLAVMDNVIEHVTDPVAQLRVIENVLRPGGRLILITPNMESGHFRLLGSRWTPELAPHVHIFLFTPSSLSTLASTAGFEVERVGAFHLDPYPVSQLLRRVASGDVKGALWRAMQESGSVYGRLIGAGSMLYVVARRPAGRQEIDARSRRNTVATV